MPHQLIVPNLHVILIHLPLGVFLLGVLIELLSFLWRRHPVRAVAHWMILLGALSMIPAATTGIYALRDVASSPSTPDDAPWSVVAANAPISADAWQALTRHVWLMAIGTLLAVSVSVVYLGCSDRLRRKLHAVAFILILIATGVLAVGAWYAGEAVYRHGVAIERQGSLTGVASQAFRSPLSATLPSGVVEPTVSLSANPPFIDKMNALMPPEQPHVALGGLAVAIALAAVGLSYRRLSRDEVFEGTSDSAEALVRSLTPPTVPLELFVSRWWLVASGFFLLTALGGFYVLASDSQTWQPKELWGMIASSDHVFIRRLAHVIAGVSLVLLPLVMAIVTRFAPRNKTLLSILTAILVLAIAAQVWFGVLLMFGSVDGLLTRLQ